jgi:hypothetical protein
MRARARQLAVALALVLVCLAVTTAAAALALHRPHLERLNTETRSRLWADYSADPRGVRMAPLDRDIIEAAAADERALVVSAETPRRSKPRTLRNARGRRPVRHLTARPEATPRSASVTTTPVRPRRAGSYQTSISPHGRHSHADRHFVPCRQHHPHAVGSPTPAETPLPSHLTTSPPRTRRCRRPPAFRHRHAHRFAE